MIAAIYARKSDEQNGVAGERKSCAQRVGLSIGIAAWLAASTLGCSSASQGGPSPGDRNVASGERNLEDATAFFAKGYKFGSSPDAGLYKYGEVRNAWDHVATFHGMADDVGLCESTVRALRETHPQERYICRLVNQ